MINNIFSNMFNNMTPVVKQLLIINILFFIGSWAVPGAKDVLSLYYFENHDFKIWQVVTHMFMHDGIAHIAFNMFALVSFGSILEHYWGAKRFLFFYFSCGLGAVLVHTAVNYYQIHSVLDTLASMNLPKTDALAILNTDFKIPGNLDSILAQTHCTVEQQNVLVQAIGNFKSGTLGASGAIYGLLIAFAFMFPDAQLSLMFIPIPIKAKYFVPIYMFLYDGFFGILGAGSMIGMASNVAHFAHIGGALMGLLLMLYWRNNKFNHKRWN